MQAFGPNKLKNLTLTKDKVSRKIKSEREVRRKSAKSNGCSLLVSIIATLEFLAKTKLLDEKGPFGGNVFRYIFLLFYCFARSVELCEIV